MELFLFLSSCSKPFGAMFVTEYLSGFLGKVEGDNQVFQGDGSGKVFSIDEVVQGRPTNTCFLGQSGEVFRAFAKDAFKVRSKGIHVLRMASFIVKVNKNTLRLELCEKNEMSKVKNLTKTALPTTSSSSI